MLSGSFLTGHFRGVPLPVHRAISLSPDWKEAQTPQCALQETLPAWLPGLGSAGLPGILGRVIMSGRSHAGLCGGFEECPRGARVPEWLGSGMDSIGSLVQNTNPRNLSSPPVACVALRAAAHFQSLFGDTEWWSQ